MATDIDLKTISAFASVSEASLTGLLSEPTIDSIKSLLTGIEKSARACEQTKSSKVKLEVELETVVRTNESKVKVLQKSRDKALTDLQKLRGDLQAAGKLLRPWSTTTVLTTNRNIKSQSRSRPRPVQNLTIV
jgi:hypothetical protein